MFRFSKSHAPTSTNSWRTNSDLFSVEGRSPIIRTEPTPTGTTALPGTRMPIPHYRPSMNGLIPSRARTGGQTIGVSMILTRPTGSRSSKLSRRQPGGRSNPMRSEQEGRCETSGGFSSMTFQLPPPTAAVTNRRRSQVEGDRQHRLRGRHRAPETRTRRPPVVTEACQLSFRQRLRTGSHRPSAGSPRAIRSPG